MSADYAVRYGDTLKVHKGQLTQGLNADGSEKIYQPPAGSTLLMCVKAAGGARYNVTCTFNAGMTEWSRAWTAADFTLITNNVAPTVTVVYTMYLELTDGSGKKLTFPDDPSKPTFELDLFATL